MHESRLHLVVACSDRKTLEPPPDLRLRDVQAESIVAQADEWTRRLASTPSRVLPAYGMYAGLHWNILSELQANAVKNGSPLDAHVCSGGYGLIQWHSLIKPYSVTFTPGHLDSIGRVEPGMTPAHAGATWWDTLAEWEGPEPAGPRSIRAIVEEDPTCAMVVVAGPHYLRAMRHDLRGAAAAMHHPDRLVLVSTGLRRLPEDCRDLQRHLLACDARWEHRFRVSRTGINAAIAADLLRRAAYAPDALTQARLSMECDAESLPPLRVYHRSKMSDEEVGAFVATRLTEDQRLAFGALLRELRDAGLACEYTRFRAIYLSTRESLNAT